jgi:hypothetical protein
LLTGQQRAGTCLWVPGVGQASQPSSSQLLIDSPQHPCGVSGNNRIRRNALGDNSSGAHDGIPAYRHAWKEDSSPTDPDVVLYHYSLGNLQAPVAGFGLKEMGSSVDLDGRPDHDMVANKHLGAIQYGALDIQIAAITDSDVATVRAIEGRLNDRVVADMAQQTGKDTLSFGLGFCEIVDSDQLLEVLAFGHEVRIKAVVGLSGEHLLSFGS